MQVQFAELAQGQGPVSPRVAEKFTAQIDASYNGALNRHMMRKTQVRFEGSVQPADFEQARLQTRQRTRTLPMFDGPSFVEDEYSDKYSSERQPVGI